MSSTRGSRADLSRVEREVLGHMLRICRLKRWLSQQGLASRLGREHSFVSRVECASQSIDVIVLLDLLKELDIDPVRFLREFLEECQRVSG